MMFRTLTISIIVAIAAALFAVPAFAQEDGSTETGSKTITEQQINDSYRVNNPRRARVTDLNVDLVSDAAVVTAVYEFRNGETATTTTTYVPSVVDGRVYWDVTGIVIDGGENISDDLLEQINA
ncbi:MAG: hypothetical protein AAFR56_02000, partial [Chloroflexota bacterium]